MAARRERDRRRPPAERRYRFATPDSELAPDDLAERLEADQQASAEEAIDEPIGDARRARTGREVDRSADQDSGRPIGTSSTSLAAAAPGRGGVRTASRPFSAYRAEYAYVVSDLRRIALVIGSLLLILILLYFVLPH
jgi:hypothetical protein